MYLPVKNQFVYHQLWTMGGTQRNMPGKNLKYSSTILLAFFGGSWRCNTYHSLIYRLLFVMNVKQEIVTTSAPREGCVYHPSPPRVDPPEKTEKKTICNDMNTWKDFDASSKSWEENNRTSTWHARKNLCDRVDLRLKTEKKKSSAF